MGEVASLDSCSTKVVDAERVRHVKDRLLDAGEARQSAELFKLLGDPTRCPAPVRLVGSGRAVRLRPG